MDLCVTIKGVSFLLQTGLGILGNLLVLLAYAHIVYCERRLQPVDMILFHLAFANMMVLLTRGVPQTMTVFQLHNLLDDVGCKIVTLNLGFCHVNFQDQLSYVINGVAVTGLDFIFMGLMVLASGYILLVLHHHSKQMKGKRSSDRHQSSMLESRAARTVITLVILYVVFFGIDNIIWIYML
ncbi:olfactory receptor class A-like protein 1 [Polyodon spathula]|uniref:olfactory receptor class A-like protein 1 n=1 Tax=Polyodon spathula TaxID=7913 RepID=UPI001B7DBF36|nr:olfactory receptor class A-like protein 1 [Polyodon spathula]